MAASVCGRGLRGRSVQGKGPVPAVADGIVAKQSFPAWVQQLKRSQQAKQRGCPPRRLLAWPCRLRQPLAGLPARPRARTLAAVSASRGATLPLTC